MASQGEALTREIPIVLHDGTILIKKRNKDKSKRFSEIIVDVNCDKEWNPRDRTKSVKIYLLTIIFKNSIILVLTVVN